LLTARSLLFRCLAAVLLVSSTAAAQSLQERQGLTSPAPPFYGRTNSFGFLLAYSNDSSPMLLGVADQRKILNIGASYSRRLILGHTVDWQYDGEVLPIALNSDPVETTTITTPNPSNPSQTITITSSAPIQYVCKPSSGTITGSGGTITFATTCSRRWVYGGGLSPVGFRWNFLPRRSLQPLLVAHGGFMVSTQQIPINYAGTFNFTFDIGTGFEWYRTHDRSLRFEYRYHHISNKNTATANPGIDNGLFQVSYVFGK
jgi:hypothetical protein